LQQIKLQHTAAEISVGEKLTQRWVTFIRHLSSNWVLCTALFSISLSFNLYRLGNPSIWFDEAFSVELARQPFPLLWHIIFSLEPNMELYYVFLHGWLALTAPIGFHPTEFVVRLPSAVFSASSTVVVFLLGQRFLGPLAGLVAAELYLLNDLQLVYAQQARSFSLQLLLICLAWYAFLTAITGASHQRRWWVSFTIATTLAIYAHLFSVIILSAQLCAFGLMLLLPGPWRQKTKSQMLPLLISLLTIGILIIPLLLVSLQGPKTGWLPIPHLSSLARLFLIISGNNKIYLLTLFASCSTALIMAIKAYLPELPQLYFRKQLPQPVEAGGKGGDACVALRPRVAHRPKFLAPSHPHQLPIALSLVCWLVIPIALSYLVSQGPLRLFSTRYLVTIVPPLLLLVGLGITSLRWHPARLLLAFALCLLALYVVPQYYKSAQVEDWNSISFWIEQHYQAGDGLVCYDNAVEQGCQISVEYYLHAYPGAAHFTEDTPGDFSWTTFSSRNPDAAVDPAALAAYSNKHHYVFFIVGRLPDNISATKAKYAQHWLDTHYHLLAQIVTPTVTVRLYATPETVDTPDTLETVSHTDSNFSHTSVTPETPETPETVSHTDSNFSHTSDTLDTLDTLKTTKS
jgi:mannosyltransferase